MGFKGIFRSREWNWMAPGRVSFWDQSETMEGSYFTKKATELMLCQDNSRGKGEGSEFVLKQSQPKFSIKHLLRA